MKETSGKYMRTWQSESTYLADAGDSVRYLEIMCPIGGPCIYSSQLGYPDEADYPNNFNDNVNGDEDATGPSSGGAFFGATAVRGGLPGLYQRSPTSTPITAS